MINGLISLIILFTYSYLIVKMYRMSIGIESAKEDNIMVSHYKNKYNRWLFLKDDLKKELTGFASHINITLILKDYILSFLIVILQSDGHIQVS